MFEPFRRLESVADTPADGTGLGLAIARRAVVQHGGTIEALAADGGGLLVVMRVPAGGAQSGAIEGVHARVVSGWTSAR